jgi:integrase
VRGFTQAIRAKIVSACSPTLAGVRDAALISVGYDTICRSSELAVMRVEHVSFEGDETTTVIIPRSKSDISGVGRVAYLSPETTSLTGSLASGERETTPHAPLRPAAANLRDGPLFRALHLSCPSDGALATSSIRRLIKRATVRAGLDSAITKDLSGHSMRVGVAQDMMVAGFDALAIMRAGGWKSANVVLRYVENAATKDLHVRRWKSLLGKDFGALAKMRGGHTP